MNSRARQRQANPHPHSPEILILDSRWADDWRNSPDEPYYRKSAYVVKVTRDGRSYYIGAGLAQMSYRLEKPDAYWAQCSFNWKHPCTEVGRIALQVSVSHRSSRDQQCGPCQLLAADVNQSSNGFSHGFDGGPLIGAGSVNLPMASTTHLWASLHRSG